MKTADQIKDFIQNLKYENALKWQTTNMYETELTALQDNLDRVINFIDEANDENNN